MTLSPEQVTDSEIEAMWDAYVIDRDVKLRDALILHYSPLVKYVASRVANGLPQNVEQSDLISYGMFGLIDAIDKFEPHLGNKFQTYGINRIRGAIFDELRVIDWVPRSVRTKTKALEKAIAKLEVRYNRSPTEEELQDELGWTEEQYQTAINQISTSGLAALDEVLGGGERGESTTLGDTIADGTQGPGGQYESAETRQLLGKAINEMPEREKIVLTLYYYENLTLNEIGRVLGVTESRVCQIHTKAVLQLKSRMSSFGDTPA